ncbi:MAG: SPOR domain-containing protein [Bacteroidetes bacterium]|nr:SPOR domain-containing protein [Bacteroidota bacterium]
MFRILILSVLILAPLSPILAQDEVYIKPLVDMLNEGRAQDVHNLLPAITAENPNDPGIIFLNAVFNQDAEAAAVVYDSLVTAFPASFAAQKAAERLIQYHNSRNEPVKAKIYQDFLTGQGIALTEQTQVTIVAPPIKIMEPVVAEKPVAKVKPVKEPESGSGKFFIQAGAFAAKNQADKALKNIKAKGFSGKVVKETTNKKIFYKVRIGPYSSDDDAQAGVGKLKSKLEINGFVVEE